MSREIDALVAEKVLGYGSESICRRTSQKWICQCGSCDHVPNYSTDIEAAWEVVEKMMTKSFEVDIIGVGAKFHCSFWRGDTQTTRCVSDSAPEAICLAALDALGVKP